MSICKSLFSFCEMYKRNSDQLSNLFSDDKRESKTKVINYFTETVPSFTTDDFQSHFQLSRLAFEVVVMLK